MFGIGTYVTYGKRGVCRIEDIGDYFRESMHDRKQYYKLSPIFSRGDEVYVPVETQVYMRDIISSDVARDYMENLENIPADTYTCRQQTQLAEHYRQMLDTNDLKVFLSLLKGIYVKEHEAHERNRKICQVDQKYLKCAENMTLGEFAVALQSTPEKIRSYIQQKTFLQSE